MANGIAVVAGVGEAGVGSWGIETEELTEEGSCSGVVVEGMVELVGVQGAGVGHWGIETRALGGCGACSGEGVEGGGTCPTPLKVRLVNTCASGNALGSITIEWFMTTD